MAMLSVVSLLVVLALSMFVVRVGAVSLRLTGMSAASARFQARSAFTGCGFTTSEAEQVVSHPMRRRILSVLMVSGSIGVTAASSSAILSFIGLERNPDLRCFLVLAGGLALVCFLATSKIVDRPLSSLISAGLRRFTSFESRDFAQLLNLGDGFQVAELAVEEGDSLVGKTLGMTCLPQDEVIVLGLTRPDGGYEGLPSGDLRIEEGQILTLYGRAGVVEELVRSPGPMREASHA